MVHGYPCKDSVKANKPYLKESSAFCSPQITFLVSYSQSVELNSLPILGPFWCNIFLFCVVDIFQLCPEMYSIVSTQTDVTLVNHQKREPVKSQLIVTYLTLGTLSHALCMGKNSQDSHFLQIHHLPPL